MTEIKYRNNSLDSSYAVCVSKRQIKIQKNAYTPQRTTIFISITVNLKTRSNNGRKKVINCYTSISAKLSIQAYKTSSKLKAQLNKC